MAAVSLAVHFFARQWSNFLAISSTSGLQFEIILVVLISRDSWLTLDSNNDKRISIVGEQPSNVIKKAI
jgi:hypothetical protein